jgi:hypothetical protein
MVRPRGARAERGRYATQLTIIEKSAGMKEYLSDRS